MNWENLSRKTQLEYLRQCLKNNILIGTAEATLNEIIDAFKTHSRKNWPWTVQNKSYDRLVRLTPSDREFLMGLEPTPILFDTLYLFVTDDMFDENFVCQTNGIVPWHVILAGGRIET